MTFDDQDKMSPVYCIGCRKHIPRAMSAAGKGLCTDCVAKLSAPTPGPPPIAKTVAYTSAQAKQPLSPWKWGSGLFVAMLVVVSIYSSEVNKSRKQEREAREKIAQDKINREMDAKLAAQRAERDRVRTARGEPIDQGRGPKPIASSWDGITPEANRWLKNSLKDYDSLEIMECSTVQPSGDNAWFQAVKYRAKNSFGAKTLEIRWFIIRNGEVIDTYAAD